MLRHLVQFDLPLLIAGALLLAGCGEAITGTELPNAAPETMVTAAPPQATPTGTVVTFYWDGFDPDGEIVGFEWRISDNGEDGIVDPADTLSSRLPWNRTTTLDSTFAVTADLPGFEDDIDDSVSIRQIRSWQSHTFFIRAIDERGMPDPTPATASFTSTTLTPNVVITIPNSVQPNTCASAPPGLAFSWEGRDPDSETTEPQAVRYLLKAFGGIGDPCLLKYEYEAGQFPIVADDPDWGPWIRYDAPLDSGLSVRFPVRPEADIGTSYIFAVQARDAAGAVTPTFEWGRNVRHFRITDTHVPLLTVSESLLGTDNFVAVNSFKRFTVASSQQVSFTWNATAESYGNLIEAYRYGFNLIDPDDPDDPGWVVPWGDGPAWKRAAPRTLSLGSPNFVVQAVDSSNQLSRATYYFQVVKTGRRAEQRRLLIVDDTPKEVLVSSSENIDRKWDTTWRRLIEGIGVIGFQAGDMIDATDNPGLITFSLLNEYRAVIWHLAPGKSFYRQELSPLSGNFNWLTVYQRDVGNLMVVGAGAVVATLGLSSWTPDIAYPIIWGTGASSPRDTDIAFHNFCVSAVDMVRPVTIWGEPDGRLLRDCQVPMYRAIARRDVDSPEIYANELATGWTDIGLGVEPAIVDSILVGGSDPPVWEDDCVSQTGRAGRETSVISLQPIGIASNVFSGRAGQPATKQEGTLLTSDFLWGFNPVQFQSTSMRTVLRWIILDHWRANEDL